MENINVVTYDKQLEDIELEEEEEEEEEVWEDWNIDDNNDEENLEIRLLCLFCDSTYSTSDELFKHCASTHHFDFHNIKRTLGLGFYRCFKLINYIRSQVAQSRCWICGLSFHTKKEFQNHFHEVVNFKERTFLWDDEAYLKPFMEEDSLLYSFSEDIEIEDEFTPCVDEDATKTLVDFGKIDIGDNNIKGKFEFECGMPFENGTMGTVFSQAGLEDANHFDNIALNEGDAIGGERSTLWDKKENNGRVSSTDIAEKKVNVVNNNYFGSYSSFSIHREMISDKVRTDAYRLAMLNNHSLLKGSVVLDVGCGTGILSLFAAQAGASRVIAVEASGKMASVTTRIVKDNGFLWSRSQDECSTRSSEVIRVVHSMVEQLDNSGHIQPFSVDVLVSEWMGYCLLYESMLSSVLLARDRWLKPGGAILPDTATMFAAGFGKGGTSIPFWENVYGFNMSCISMEVMEHAARTPIVDVIDSSDIVTNSAILQTFDLARMKPEEMDFTAMIELNLKPDVSETNGTNSTATTTWCYGLVLWFETGFTSRFCKEMPIVLSTSPYTPKTHWAQTLLTFGEPVALTSSKAVFDRTAAVGTDICPAVKLSSRISIVRASQHRSIDISMETTAIGFDGRKRGLPVQIFNLS